MSHTYKLLQTNCLLYSTTKCHFKCHVYKDAHKVNYCITWFKTTQAYKVHLQTWSSIFKCAYSLWLEKSMSNDTIDSSSITIKVIVCSLVCWWFMVDGSLFPYSWLNDSDCNPMAASNLCHSFACVGMDPSCLQTECVVLFLPKWQLIRCFDNLFVPSYLELNHKEECEITSFKLTEAKISVETKNKHVIGNLVIILITCY